MNNNKLMKDKKCEFAFGNLPSNAHWKSVAYGNGRFIALAFDRVAMSFDGVAWMPIALPPSVNASLQSVTYGCGKFVILTIDEVVAASVDGIAWELGTLPEPQPNWQITYGNGKFVAIATSYGNRAITSVNGIDWMSGIVPGAYADWSSIAYGNGKFMAVAHGSNRVISSAEGTDWEEVSMLPTNAAGYSVAFGNGRFVATAFNGYAVATSVDGDTWYSRTLPYAAAWRPVIYGNGKFVVVADNVVAASDDGITWEQGALPMSSNLDWLPVIYANGIFVTVAQNTNLAAISSDGLVWDPRDLQNVAQWQSMAYGKGAFIAVATSSSNTVAISITKADLIVPKSKYQLLTAGRAGSGKINLATGALEFVHEDVKFDSNILPINVAHVYSSEEATKSLSQDAKEQQAQLRYGKGFKLNLQQKLTHKAGEDTKWKYIDGSGVEHRFKEKYYFWGKDYHGNEKKFYRPLRAEDIEITQEGKLFEIGCPERELFAEIKTPNGLTLHTELKNFHGSSKLDLRQAEVAQLEEEIKSLVRNLDEVGFLVNETRLPIMTETELFSLNIPSLTLAEKQKYYQVLKKKYEEILKKADDQDIWEIKPDYQVLKTLGFGYIDEVGNKLDELSVKTTADRIYNTVYGAGYADQRINLREHAIKQKEFNDRLEKIKQKMDEISSGFSWEKSLEDLQKINLLLEQKRTSYNKLRFQLPVNYVINQDGIVLGFNNNENGGKLVSIFDSYDNQVAIVYEKDRIGRVVDNEEREIIFEYDADERLVAIIDFQDRKTLFRYEHETNPGLLTSIVYPNGEKSTFNYDGNNLLNEMISPSGIGINLQYANNKVELVAKKSYLIDSHSEAPCGNILADYYTNISAEGYGLHASEYSQEDLFSISYDVFGKTTTVSELTGESGSSVGKGIKEISYFNFNWDLIAEYRFVSVLKGGAAVDVPEKIVLYDEKPNDYEFMFEQTEFASGSTPQQIISDYISNWSSFVLDGNNGVKSKFTAGNWRFTKFDEETGNITAEHNNEKTLLGGVKSEVYKTFKYDLRTNLLIEEIAHEIFAGVAKEPLSTRYEYNKQGKLIRTIDPKGVVSAIIYDKRGNVVKTMTYHKDMPGTKFCQEREIAENGQVKAEVDEFCESKTKLEYIDGTNLVRTADTDGNVTAFGYDANTDDVLEITTSTNGDVNNVVSKYTADYLTKLTSGNTEIRYTYDRWGRKTSISIDDEVHVMILYDDINANDPLGSIITTQFINGEVFTSSYDRFGKLGNVKRFDGKIWRTLTACTYDEQNRLRVVEDDVAGTTMFNYDANGNLMGTVQGDVVITPSIGQDGKSQSVSYQVGNDAPQVYTQSFDKFGELKSLVLPAGDGLTVEKDGLGRLTKSTLQIANSPASGTNGNSHSYNSVSFADDSWETINAIAEAGLARSYYNVGDEKTITLSTQQTITVQILGFDHDNLADGSGKAGITCGMKNLLSMSYPMNTGATNVGGWNSSLMRTTTLPSFFAQLPSDLQSIIKTVGKPALAGNRSADIVISNDKLWLFSQEEILGGFFGTPGISGEGQQYEYWNQVGGQNMPQDANPVRVKGFGTSGVACPWFLRSSTMFADTSFCMIATAGASDYGNASFSRGVCFGFAIGNETVQDEGISDDPAVSGRVEISTSYSYLQKGDHASGLVSRVTQKIGDETIRTRYVYDNRGNITEVRDGFNRLVSGYEYDGLNRLVKDNDTEIGYDNNGNILYRKNGDEIDQYEYDGDRLMNFNGKKFSYDVLGNPILYKNEQMTWDFRNLSEYKGVQFKYRADGVRVKKTRDSLVTDYIWAGDKLLREKTAGGYTLDYIHGIDGIIGFKLSDFQYWYVKNLQGDVIAIYDGAGQIKAEYEYDAFGNHTVINHTPECIGDYNPIRYRSYYWDESIGLYYLKSRYYDPETGRFVSADVIEVLDESQYFINGLNLYVYCGNDPINRTDETGKKWWKWVVGGLAVVGLAALTVASFGIAAPLGIAVIGGMMLGGGIGAATGITSGLSFGDVVLSTLGGALVGGALAFASGLGMMAGTAYLGTTGATSLTAIATTGLGAKITIGGAALLAASSVGLANAIDYSINTGVANKGWDLGKAITSFVTGNIFGLASFGVGFALGRAGLGLGKMPNWTDWSARFLSKLILNSIAWGSVRWVTNRAIRRK